MDEPVHHSESPFLDFLGTRVEDWSDGYARISLDLEPHHLNRAGVIHGGVLATLLDHGAGFCGLYCTVPGNRRYGMTLSLTCNFVAQANTGRVTVVGRRTTAGRKIYFAETEARTEEGVLLATGTSVHRFRSGSESPEGVPPRGATA